MINKRLTFTQQSVISLQLDFIKKGIKIRHNLIYTRNQL